MLSCEGQALALPGVTRGAHGRTGALRGKPSRSPA